MFDWHAVNNACSRAFASAGSKSPTSNAMIAITTRISISVKARRTQPPSPETARTTTIATPPDRQAPSKTNKKTQNHAKSPHVAPARKQRQVHHATQNAGRKYTTPAIRIQIQSMAKGQNALKTNNQPADPSIQQPSAHAELLLQIQHISSPKQNQTTQHPPQQEHPNTAITLPHKEPTPSNTLPTNTRTQHSTRPNPQTYPSSLHNPKHHNTKKHHQTP